MKDLALRIIAELEDEADIDIYTDVLFPEDIKDAANLGRIGGLHLAILKIKVAFDLPLTD